MTALIKRYVWAGHLFLITACAALAADLTNLVIRTRLETTQAASHREALASLPFPASSSALGGSGGGSGISSISATIVEGNIFNPQLRGKMMEERPVESVPLPPQQPLKISLIGTSVGEDVVYAVIEDQVSREQGVYRIGDVVAQEARIVTIERNTVTFERGGVKEVLEAYLVRPDSGLLASPPPPLAGPTAGGIAKVASNRWVLDRREVEGELENMAQLMTKARVVPNFSDGKPDGFRIFAIVPSSLYDKIGLQNGDVIQRINGMDIKDPESFFRVFQQLRQENRIALDMVRNNQKDTFEYEIR